MLTTLTVLSYKLSKRPDAGPAYEGLLEKAFELLGRHDFSDLLRIRLIFFVCYHLDNLYCGCSDFSYLLPFHAFLHEGCSLVLRLVVLDLLENAFSDKQLGEFLRPSVTPSLLSLTGFLTVNQPDEMFNLVKGIVRDFHQSVSEECVDALLAAVTRIVQQENQLCLLDRTKDINRLISAFNILL